MHVRRRSRQHPHGPEICRPRRVHDLGDQITSYETYRRVHFVFLSTSAGTKAGWLDGAVPINHPGCVHGKGVWVDTSFRVMEEGWFAAAAGTWLSGQDIGP